MKFSFIIPIYNRREELREFLQSFTAMQKSGIDWELLIVDDGSSEQLEDLVVASEAKYIRIPNGGPAAARNVGLKRASGDFFIFLDSDTILPQNYLQKVMDGIAAQQLDAFGGSDRAAADFSPFQKAVNFSMTSWVTTGGIRGKKANAKNFYPRSFNMGFSREVYDKTEGFSAMRYGEDIDLSIRIKNAGFRSGFISEASVYHKRRANTKQFFKQTYQFGTARPILNRKYPESAKLTFWFPSLFILGLLFSFYRDLYLVYVFYLGLIFVISSFLNRSLLVGGLSIWTSLIQFFGYGLGFLKSQFRT